MNCAGLFPELPDCEPDYSGKMRRGKRIRVDKKKRYIRNQPIQYTTIIPTVPDERLSRGW